LRTDPEVVLLSSRREREDLQQAYSAGADHFLTKPFDTAELIPLLAGIAARVHDQRLAEAGLQHAADKIGPAGVHHRDLADLREKAFRRMG
jgi:CheY-like chemotaxis protein